MAMSLPEVVPQFELEDAEIKALLWPFDGNSEFKTLEEIGFELNLTPEMLYLFIPSSFPDHFMHEVVREQIESMPTNQLLQQPTQLLQSNAANHHEQEPRRVQERVVDGSELPSEAAKQNKKSSGASKKSIKKRSLDDDSWMPEGWVKQVNKRPSRGKFPCYVNKKYYAPGVRRAFRSKIEALRYIEKQRNSTTGSGDLQA